MNIVNLPSARDLLVNLASGQPINLREIEAQDERPSGVAESAILEARTRLEHLLPPGDSPSSFTMFESDASIALHERLKPTPAAIGDRGFWAWLSLNYFADIIKRRHPWGEAGPRPENYGLGPRFEGLVLRLWMRGELGYSAGKIDPYYYAKLGNVDMWRSHVLRVDHGSCQHVSRAFLKQSFDPDDNAPPKLETVQVRALAKALRRLHAVMPLELLDEAQAKSVVETETRRILVAK